MAQSVELVNRAIKEFHQLSQQPVWALAENYRYTQCSHSLRAITFKLAYGTLLQLLLTPAMV